MTKTICVFSGSRPGRATEYQIQAAALADALADALPGEPCALMYGGGSRGLMGTVSARAIKRGVVVTGVVPRGLFALEAPRSDLEHFIVTDDMHTRKRTMYDGASGFVVLPGGTGTLDEFFEVLTWNHIGAHSKPIALLNVNGYYDGLRTLLEHMGHEGFAASLFDERLCFTADPIAAVRFAAGAPSTGAPPA